jgi:hypothetical protein
VIAIAAAALATLMAASSTFPMAAARPRKPAPPPKVLNVVRQKVKRAAVHSYESLEATIVKAYGRAQVPLFWTCLQSKSDATDILYLNTADSIEQWDQGPAIYARAIAAHPDLVKLGDRLRTFQNGAPTSTLTTRREDVEYGRPDVDLRSMKALRLTVFEVRAGHEGRFMRAMRMGAGGGSPWLLYEANDSSTFFLMAPMRSAAEARKGPALPHGVQELKNVYTVTQSTVYLTRPTMSRVELRTKK